MEKQLGQQLSWGGTGFLAIPVIWTFLYGHRSKQKRVCVEFCLLNVERWKHQKVLGKDRMTALTEDNFSVYLYKCHLQAPQTLLQWGKPWPAASLFFFYFSNRFSNLCHAQHLLGCVWGLLVAQEHGISSPGGTCQWRMSLPHWSRLDTQIHCCLSNSTSFPPEL